MERRRRALGLRKPSSSEDKAAKSRPSPLKRVENEENLEAGKPPQNYETGSMTLTAQKTPKRITSLKTESPSSPLVSPVGPLMVIPRIFGSPEVEVSWDFSCSQVPSEKLPTRKVKHATQVSLPPIVEPVISCPRLMPTKQISEEENQERLAFYKELLSLGVKRKDKDVATNNNNLEKPAGSEPSSITTTPKRPHQSMESAKKDHFSTFFDDSANDFMLECSQAIEEQLKNGDINLGSVITIQLPNKRLPESPLEYTENSLKKVCHGKTKLNLFPESPNFESHGNHSSKKRPLSLRSPQSKQSNNAKTPTVNSIKDCDTMMPNLNRNQNKLYENDDNVMFMRTTQSMPTNKMALTNKVHPSTAEVSSNSEMSRVNNKFDSGSVPSEAVSNGISLHQGPLEKRPQIKPGEHLNSVAGIKNFVSKNPPINAVNTNGGVNVHRGPLETRPSQTKPAVPLNSVAGNKNFVSKSLPIKAGITGNNDVKVHREPLGSRPSQIKPGVPLHSVPGSGYNRTYQSSASTVQTNVERVQYDSVDKFRRVPKSITPVSKQPVTTTNSSTVPTNCKTSTTDCKPEDTKSTSAIDITSLLDDGFDMDLCSLDFESLCCNSQRKEPQVQPDSEKHVPATSVVAPKKCSQQEIEAKRKAALNRLMMKKKR